MTDGGSGAVPPRLWTQPGYVTLAGGLLLALVFPNLVQQIRYLPLAASLLVLGLPHGAVDHLVPGWALGRPLDPPRLRRLIGAYVAVAGAGLVLWWLAPLAALALFFAVTVVHWGSSELFWFAPQRRPVAFAAARGLVPVILPALAFPAAFAQAIHVLLSPFLSHPPVIEPGGGLRSAGLLGLALVCAAGAGDGPRERLELAGLVTFFALVEPVFAVGLYFIAWHSWRHVVRLATLEPRAAAELEYGRQRAAVRLVLRSATPCTALALVGLGGLVAVAAVDPGSASQVTAVALALIAALTVPHALVVGWLDGARGPAAGRVGRPTRLPRAVHRT